MYFNLDHQRKLRILNYYKKEADEYRKKKEEEKKQKIQEELSYLQEREKKQQESDEQLSLEESRKKKALMEEYLEMLQKTKNYLPGYHFKPKNNEVIINNWGKSKEETIEENNNYYNLINSKNKSVAFNENSFNNKEFNALNSKDKVRLLIRPIDSMNKFLTDEQNENEVKSFFLKQKKNKQNYYKDLLYSQYENTAKKNKNIFGTEDMLILQQKKKKLITENPYRQKNEYFVGDSNLKNNPILNPENNMRYNKYLKNFYKDITLIDNNAPSNDNDMKIKVDEYNNNFIKYDNNAKNTNNYMAMNGSNIISDYKINNDINKYKLNNNNGLSRNFSDIYNNYKTSNDVYSNINNIGNKHKMLSMSKRSMSQIQI